MFLRRLILFIVVLFLFGCGGQSKEDLVQEGQRLLDAGNFRGAVVLFKNALEKDGNDLAARRGLAEATLQQGDLTQAEKEFQGLLAANPADKAARLKLASIYLSQQKAEQALLELDKFHSENQETVDSLVLNGRVYLLLGDLPSAESLFKNALQLEPAASEPRVELARLFLQANKPDKAQMYLRQVIDADSGYVQAYYLLGRLQSKLGEREAALQTFLGLADAAPGEIQAFYMSGILQIDLGLLDEAQATVETISEAFPGQAESSRLKGLLLYRKGEYEKSAVVLKGSLNKEPHLLGYFFLGLAYYSQGQYEQALNQFQHALDMSPDFERARTLVAMTLLKQKRIDDAILQIEQVLRVAPGNAYAHNILGSAFLAAGEYDKGLEELEKATELDPTLSEAHVKSGLFHLSQGEGAQGEADLTKAVNAAPEVLNSRLMLASVYLREKKYSEAIQLLTEGMDGSKSDALLDNYLAAVYFSRKEPGKAVAALKDAIRINPGYLTPRFNLAGYLVSISEYADALQEYQQILKKNKNNFRALLGMAAIYNVLGREIDLEATYQRIADIGTEQGYLAAAQYFLRKKDLTEALAVIERGLARHPESAALLDFKGNTLVAGQQMAEAESVFVRLAVKDPERGNRLLLSLYLTTGRSEQARSLVDSLLKASPDEEYPYLLASAFFLSREDQATAESTLQTGIARLSQSARLSLQLGRLYERGGSLQLAEKTYRSIVESYPDFSPAYTSLGFLCERRDQNEQALAYYKKALSFDGNSIPALNNIAYLLADRFGAADEALSYAIKAYRLEPDDPRIMDTFGYVLVKSKRPKDAEPLLMKASELLPEIPEIKLHLAMAKLAIGDKISAGDLIAELIKGTGPEAEAARSLQQQL